MLPYEWPSTSVCRRESADPGSDPLRTVIWIRGEHDVATRMHLTGTITKAALHADADVAVDLGGVTFMDASTIGALLVARNRLRASSHSLYVRAPSPCARRLLELCGLAALIDESPAQRRPSTVPALDSWVAVPATDADKPPVARPGAPARRPAHRTALAPMEPTGSMQRRAPS